MTELDRIYSGNALDILKEWPDGCVHCAITSPPYWGLRQYGTDGVAWPSLDYAPMACLPPLHIPEWFGELGQEPTLEMFVGHLVLIFREVRRVLRPGSTLWLNFGDGYSGSNKDVMADGSQVGGTKQLTNSGSVTGGLKKTGTPSGLKPKDLLGQPWRVAFALQADGWWLRMDNIWHKTNPMPSSAVDRPTTNHEYVFLFANAPHYYYDAEAIKTPSKETSIARTYRGRSDTHKRIDGIPGQTKQTLDKPRPNRSADHKRVNGAPGQKKHTIHLPKQDELGKRTYTGFNARYDNDPATMSNKRSVWTISTKPFGEAHFATYPKELVIDPIKAGCPLKVCAECGAPYIRTIATTFVPQPDVSEERVAFRGKGLDKSNSWRGFPRGTNHVETTGFARTCTCLTDETCPGTVLDPFFGSGTTGVVAQELARHFVGIEVNETYIQIAEQRLRLPPEKRSVATKELDVTDLPLFQEME